MYFDALECLPEDKDTSLTEEKCKPVSNSRKVGGGGGAQYIHVCSTCIPLTAASFWYIIFTSPFCVQSLKYKGKCLFNSYN